MMRVLFNCLSAMGVRTGVGHHTAELLRALRRLAGQRQTGADLRIDVYPSGGIRWLSTIGARLFTSLGREGNAGPKSAAASAPLTKRVARGIAAWGRAALDRHARSAFFGRPHHLYHEPNFIPRPSDLPTLTTWHDLSALAHPEWHPPERVAWFERELPRTLAQSTHFLAVSGFTRREVIRVLGVAPERITCVHNGIRAECRSLPAAIVARRLRRLDLASGYLLCVGTIEPRKNVLTLMKAYCGLPAPLREQCPLLLAGAWGWNAAAVADYFHDQARSRGVRHLGYVRVGDLPALYNGARALVYPSHYEGFGLPVAEMLACGGAVVASTADALREVAGDRAHYVEADDVDGWRAALARVIHDDEWRQALRHGAVERARSFSWDRAAAETLAVYRHLTSGAALASRAASASRAA
ncbi:MAG: glycosyltransferase family 4 protein [Gemmataceae bacterium]|nr:glycosyltransferase family 4 protein [Gemmataceae bacterium]